MKLIIVDDEKIEREALKYFFAQNNLGVEVVGEAANGIQAVQLNQSLKPDIITMDIRMGIMDGLKATECIKRDNPEVEIIILTAFGLFEYSQQAIKNRVFDYLLKPVEEQELITTIEKVKKHIKAKSEKAGGNQVTKLFDYWLNQQKEEQKNKYKIFNDKRISKVVDYIMDNLNQDLNLEYLSSLVYMNSSYLSRLFKSITGVTISNFILEARIEKAKFLLVNDPHKPIRNISEEVGFSSIQHFSNTFKKQEGMAPAEYRQERGVV
ncbi:MAG: response regulator transcription factor [Peptococcales bacterium]|jgi:two-component system response regulator YesN